jgi:hypothetical protein
VRASPCLALLGINVHLRLTDHELYDRYRHAHNPIERSHWQFLWLAAHGFDLLPEMALK